MLHKVTLEDYGFTFVVAEVSEDDIEDKLALASPETGLISRMSYQNFLFSELVLNVERLFTFIGENSGGDPDEQIKYRNKIEDLIYTVNPAFNPINLVLSKSGVIKLSSKATGIPIKDNADWDKIIDDINPFMEFEELDLIDESEIIGDEELPMDYGIFETIQKRWERANLLLLIRKFSKDNIGYIFDQHTSFPDLQSYKLCVVQRCVESLNEIFNLCKSTELIKKVEDLHGITDELYQLCLTVNPFLESGEIDLKSIKKKFPDKINKARSAHNKKSELSKKSDSREFSSVTKDELLTLADKIKQKVIGQDDAIDKIVDSIQIASCGLRDSESPIAVFLLCGTTGIGKTLSAKILAEELCGSRDCLVRVDCSEYTQQHDIQKLLGAPPSYIGHDDGGYLTNAVQKNPFSVVLFDEIEKAHSKLFDLLLQILDDARLTDGKGRVTDFRQCVILLTSNIGVSEIEQIRQTMGFGDRAVLTFDKQKEALKKALKDKFRPEFLNRIDDVISFKPLEKDDILRIIDLLLLKVQGYLTEKKVELKFSDNVREMLFERGFSKRYGARPIQRVLDREVIRNLAKMLLSGELSTNSKVLIEYKDNELKVIHTARRSKKVI